MSFHLRFAGQQPDQGPWQTGARMPAAALLQLTAARRERGQVLPEPLIMFKRSRETEFLKKYLSTYNVTTNSKFYLTFAESASCLKPSV